MNQQPETAPTLSFEEIERELEETLHYHLCSVIAQLILDREGLEPGEDWGDLVRYLIHPTRVPSNVKSIAAEVAALADEALQAHIDGDSERERAVEAKLYEAWDRCFARDRRFSLADASKGGQKKGANFRERDRELILDAIEYFSNHPRTSATQASRDLAPKYKIDPETARRVISKPIQALKKYMSDQERRPDRRDPA